MTAKFLEDRGYANKDLQMELTRNFEKENESFGVLLLSKDDPLYQKRLVEAILNLNASVLQHSISKESSELHDDHMWTIKLLGSFCGYYVGCTSWEVNKIKDFDKQELIDRLLKLIGHIQRS